MLRRLNVRMRLAIVLLVPLVLFVAVAGPGLLQRQEAARDADRAAELAVTSAELTQLVDALQQERTLTSALRAGAGDDLEERLRDQRARTDEAATTVLAAFSALGRIAPGLEPLVRPAHEDLADLGSVRESSDRSASIVPWVDPFRPVLVGLLELNEALSTGIDEAHVRGALTEVSLLSWSKEAAAQQAAQLAAAATWDELRGDQLGILSGLRADELAFRTAHLAATPGVSKVDRRAAVSAGAATTAGRAVDEAIRTGSPGAIGELESWLTLGAARQDVLRSVEVDRTADALDAALAAGTSARRDSAVYVVLVGFGLLVAVVLAVAAARSITRPLRRLTQAADHLAEERLPQLVDALRHPGEYDERFLADTLQPIEVQSHDELGHLTRSFNTVQTVAVDVAAAQAQLLRKGISDLYLNLARRNQSLFERQIRLLDEVERIDQDPEVLERLYELDHLATRMRRNAESLLVLAGAEPDRRRARPAPAVEVLRAAVSEVEFYRRVEVGSVTPVELVGLAVSDVSHIVAELLDNATRFSPPSTVVRVDARRTGSGYQIEIVDEGVGVPPAQLDELNQLLREPPVTGLALGRALGCLVAGRLAARHAIAVQLQPREGGGLVATVTLPRHLLSTAPEEPMIEPLPVVAPSEPIDDPWFYEWGEDAGPITIGVVPDPPALGAPSSLREAVQTGTSLDATLDALLDDEHPAALTEPPVATAAHPVPSRSGTTESGLTRRMRAAAERAVPTPPSEPSARRSPEEVRSMLARYRQGIRAGRDTVNRAIEE